MQSQIIGRRTFLGGAAIIAVTASTTAAIACSSRSEIDILYEERTKLAARSRDLREQYRAAEAGLPWWAQPGHTHLRGNFEINLIWSGEKRRPGIRATYRRRMRELVARLRAQREEELKVGIPGITSQMDFIGERLSEIDEKIENLSVTAADAAQKAAAVILITSLYDHWRNSDCFGNSATLVALRPFLIGQVREHVDYVVEHPDHEMWAMPFYSAV